MKKKEFIITCIFIIVTLFIYGIFPTVNNFQNIATAVLFLAGIPLLYNFFITKKPLRELGFSIGSWRAGLLWSFVSLVCALLIFYIAVYYLDFPQEYVLGESIAANFWRFLWYELTIVLPFIVLYEIFFRGFGMFFIGKEFGYIAIFAQMAVFFLFLLFTGSLDWHFAPYLLFSFFSGIIVYKSRSLYYSVIAHMIFLIIVDASVIKILQ